MQGRIRTILFAAGIPAGLMLAIFSASLFIGGALGAGGGDMPAGTPVNQGMYFSRYVMYAGGAGLALGVLLFLTSLVALIFRLITKPKD